MIAGAFARAVARAVGLTLALACASAPVGASWAVAALDAQVRPDSLRADSLRVDSLRVDSLRADSTRRAEFARREAELRATAAAERAEAQRRLLVRGRPPLSPRNAFFVSALVPGLAQTRLDRSGAGALFAGVELAALLMVRRSRDDVREARRFRLDSLPETFTVDPATGGRTPVGVVEDGFPDDLVRTRQLAVEDWLAVVVFNHLLAGADAFVSAQLWDVPRRVGVVPTPRGLALAVHIPFGAPSTRPARRAARR